MNKSKYYLFIYGTGFVASIFWTLLFNHWLFPLDYFLRMLSGIHLFIGVITIFRNEPKSFTITFLVESIALMGLSSLKLPVITLELFIDKILPIALIIGTIITSYYFILIRPFKPNLNARLYHLQKSAQDPTSRKKSSFKSFNDKMPTMEDYERIKKEFEKETGRKCSDEEMLTMLTDILLSEQGFNPADYDNDKLIKEYIRFERLIRSGQADEEESLSISKEKFKLIKQEIKNRRIKAIKIK